MKVVVDTNVVAYLLLGPEAFVDEAKAVVGKVSHPLAAAHWEAELANVVWMAWSSLDQLDIILPDGTERWVTERADITYDDLGRPVNLVGVVQDITDRKRTEQTIQRLAFVDSLTDLPNRAPCSSA